MRVPRPYRWTCIVLSILLLGLIAWTPAPARAEEPRSGRCLALQKDLTDPTFLEFLQQHPGIPAGASRTVYLSHSKKISQQTFLIGDGLNKQIAATVSCTGSCTGGCGVSGCDVTSSLGCSSCECTGGSCTCTCTKKSTAVSDSQR